MAVRKEYVADLYRNILHREGSDADIEGHLNNPGGEQGLYDLFSSVAGNQSDGRTNEATVGSAPQQQYQSTYQTQGDSPVLDPGPIHGYDAGPVSPATGSATSGNDYSAFNLGRAQDINKSAKDAFAQITSQAPPPPFHDKKAMAQWFDQYVRPGMNALGHNVSSVSEDGFTYSNPEGTFFVDFGQNSGAAPGSMLQRLQWNATPADAATAAKYATSGSGGAATNPRSNAGTMQDIRSLYQNVGQLYGGPGSAGNNTGPVQQVGQDPFSFLLTGGLSDFLERGGTTPFGEQVRDAVMGRLTENPNISRRFESARELMDKGRRTQANDARAALANRGLLSEPGIPQGAEIGAIKRIEDNIAPEFSRALRDIYTDETENALSLATGMASDEAKQFLAGIGEGTARQSALANIALQSLGQNMAWSQFLAEFGLKRDQVLNELQNGRVDDVMQLLQAFITAASLSSRGYVGA